MVRRPPVLLVGREGFWRALLPASQEAGRVGGGSGGPKAKAAPRVAASDDASHKEADALEAARPATGARGASSAEATKTK